MAKNIFEDLLETLTYDDTNDAANARGYLGNVTGAYDGISAPDINPLTLSDFLYEGDLEQLSTPSQLRAEQVGYNPIEARLAQMSKLDGTAYDQINTDPRLRANQLASLAALQEIVDGNGMNAVDAANMAKIRSEVAQQDTGRREAILQGARQRGMLGSGDELLAQLSSGQAATERAAQMGMDQAAQMQARRLAAIQGLADGSGALRSQDFGEAERIAQARDAINQYNTSTANQFAQYNTNAQNQNNQFNAQNQLNTDRFNADARTNANQFNIGNQMDTATRNAQIAEGNRNAKQAVSNANTQAKNTAAQYNNQLGQQAFDNQFSIANSKAGAAGAGVNYYNQQQATKNAAKGNMLGSIVGAGTTAAVMASDENSKKDIFDLSDSDIEEFLSSLEPKEFNYKDEAKHGEGRRAGIMAQDVEKSKLGSMIVTEDEEGVKSLDKDKTLSLMLAALGHIAKKMEN